MAKYTITLDDDLAAKYESIAKISNMPVEKWMSTQLIQFQNILPTSRFIVLMGDNRKAIEKLLGGGTLSSPEQLIENLKKRLANKFASVEFILSESEEREIARRAAKNNVTPEAELQRMFNYVKPLIFGS